MADRNQLIACKEEVRTQLAQAHSELAREQARPQPRANRLRELESRIDGLMADESRLRREIDRSR